MADKRENKRYYWIKLKEDFFSSKEIKRLRKLAGGDTYVIIYLKMLIRSLTNNGFLYFEGVEENFISELALDIDEDEDNVAVAVQYFMSRNILVEISEEEYFLTTCSDMVGSETESTARSRKSRESKKALQCNTDATHEQPKCVIEKEIEIDIELENRDRVNYQLIADMYNATCVSFPRLKTLSDKRKKAIKARLKTYSVEDFQKLFDMAEASGFLKGKNNRNWSATFDWLIADANMAKVLDGNYSDKSGTSQAPVTTAKEDKPEWMKHMDMTPYENDPFDRGGGENGA